MLVHQLADIAATYPGIDKAASRLPIALDKLGKLCLRYCLKGLINGDELGAQRYYHLAQAIFPKIQEDVLYSDLTSYWTKGVIDQEVILSDLIAKSPQVVKRDMSYPVPPGSIRC